MTALERLQNNRNALGMLFMLPAALLLLVFLTYPLGLGFWLGFTDAKVGRPGVWVGLENYEFLWNDSVTRLALFNTLFYTFVASVIKFALGLWLALLPIFGVNSTALSGASGALQSTGPLAGIFS